METDGESSSSLKQIPYYKKIVGTRFAIDAFNYEESPEITYYLLSHFHYDHYIGLNANFTGNILTSPITGRLIVDRIGVKTNHVIMVDIHQPIVIDGVTVVLIDAFHCPGSVMFLFILPDGKRILHTGDFRASPEMEKNNFLTEKPIDHIYLDTTYCHPDYNFPKQGETLQMVIDLTLEYLAKEPKLLIVCGAYTIGKEKVFKCLCETLCMNLWVPSSKLQVLLSMNDPVIQQHLVLDKDEAQIHVLPMTDINHEFLRGYLRGCRDRFASILAFKPSGWQNYEDSSSAIVPAIQDNVYIYGIPYSEHSSYSELERFIKFFKPRMITPTVFHSDSKFRVMMLRSIAQWKSTYLQNGDQQSSA